MRALVAAIVIIVVASISAAMGIVAGVLMVRYVFPPPALLADGGREGTPIQIGAFFGTFVVVWSLCFAALLELWNEWRRRANQPSASHASGGGA